MSKYKFPLLFDHLGVLVLIDYNEINYKYIASYLNGIEKIRSEYFSVDEALENVKKGIGSVL